MKNSFLFLSIGLLVFEIILVISLRTLGWVGTGNSAKWIGSLVAAAIPLVIAFGLFLKSGRRFSLRALLISMALVSIFLFVSVLPLLEANRARSGARRLMSAGIDFDTAEMNKIYERLGHDPRAGRSTVPIDGDVPSWLVPIAGKLLKIPPDKSIRSVSLASDAHVETLCESPVLFSNLYDIGLGTGVSPHGMNVMRNSLPKFRNVVAISVYDLDPSPEWLNSLVTIKSLRLSSERRPRMLSTEQLTAIADLPNLELLWFYMYPITDQDVTVFERTKTLRYAFFRYSGVTAAGKQQLEATLPECTVGF